MSLEITGKVIKILEKQKFVSSKNGNEYVKNTFVLETSGQYPKKVAFSVLGDDKFTQMDIRVGSSYNVSFDVESREWQGRWFTDCAAWKVLSLDGETQENAPKVQSQPQSPVSNGGPMVEKAVNANDSAPNDLPF